MKKALIILLIALTFLCVFVGCYADKREGINSNIKFLHFVDENGNTLLDYQLDQYFSSDNLQKQLDEIVVEHCSFDKGVYLDGTVFSVEKDKINEYLLNHDRDLTISKKVLLVDADWAAYTVILYFVPDEYSISYVNVEGATFDGPATYNINSDLTLPTPVKKFYRFLGWNEYGAGADSSTPITSLPSVPRNITLEAQWQEIAFTVAYDGVPSSIANDNKTSITLSDGAYSLNNIQSTSAYEFNGWKLNGELVTSLDPDELWNADADYFDPDACTVKLVADIAFKEFTAKYYVDEQLIENQKFDFLTKDSLQAPAVPSKEHYTGSWSEEVTECKDYEIHAVYDVQKYQVTVDTGISGYPFEAQSYVWDTKYQVIYQQLSYPDKKLIGLYFDADFTERVNEDSLIAASGTLYAKWITQYEITSASDWNWLSQAPDANYILTNDIDFQSQPIPNISNFNGVLDGQGHTVYGFVNSVDDCSTTYGLFNLNKGTICNINFDDGVYSVATAPGIFDTSVGFLCGINRGTIQNVTVSNVEITIVNNFTTVSQTTSSNTIEPHLNAGVLSGTNMGTITYSSLSDTVTVEIDTNMYTVTKINNGDNIRVWAHYGALAGSNKGVVDYITSAASLTSKAEYLQSEVGPFESYYKWIYFIQQIGGIVGNNSEAATVSNTLVEATLMTDTAHRKVASQGYFAIVDVGGVVGDNNGIVDKCQTGTNTVFDVLAAAELRIGGICAVNEGSAAMIRASYSQAKFSAYSKSSTDNDSIYCGGIVGLNSATVTHCYSVVDEVSVSFHSQEQHYGFFGGIFGTNSSSVVKCFTVLNASAPNSVSNVSATHIGIVDNGIVRDCYYYLTSNAQGYGENACGTECETKEDLLTEVAKLGYDEMGYTLEDGEYPVLADVGDNRTEA